MAHTVEKMSDLAVAEARRQLPTMVAPPVTGNRQPVVDLGLVYSGERTWLERLFRSIQTAEESVPMRIRLVCNPQVPSRKIIRQSPVPVRLIRNARRRTYAENFNRVLREGDAPFSLVMNTDMFFSPASRCVSTLVSGMQQHPRCGVGGCRVYLPAGQYAFPARRVPSPAMIAARRFAWFPRSKNQLSDYLYRDRSPTESFECDWHSGCFLCIRRAAVEDVGGFDTRFRKYFEDVDLCQRMRRQGWEVRHFGEPHVWHDEQRASRDWLSRDAWLHLRAYYLWLRKQS